MDEYDNPFIFNWYIHSDIDAQSILIQSKSNYVGVVSLLVTGLEILLKRAKLGRIKHQSYQPATFSLLSKDLVCTGCAWPCCV